MDDWFAENCEVAVDEDMVHMTWTVGHPTRVVARGHMPRRRWWTLITTIYESGTGRPNGTL